ncbi:hypothetical protein [Novosphingobium terrae]|uniref:hypothetical protein n=1 Tax=Novosphingobium terrae TaxID=2726189 RepID=UPI00197E1AC8|nr:hypothetical protein [Novosphingobium terrae]
MGDTYTKRLNYSRKYAGERRRQLKEQGFTMITLALSPAAVQAVDAVKKGARLKSRESAINTVMSSLPDEHIQAIIKKCDK